MENIQTENFSATSLISKKGNLMEQEFENHLTAAEVGILWSQYLNSTLTDCMYKYFTVQNEDREIGRVLESAERITQSKIQRIKNFFKSDNYPIPIGFTDTEINTNAPKLYSDPFFLAYIRSIAGLGLSFYALALTTTDRQDIRNHLNQCITDLVQIDNEALKVQKAKNSYDRYPYIPTPEKPEFIEDSSFLGSFFGEQRPLSAIEIANIYLGCQKTMLTKALLMGFSQVAELKELRSFFLRGKQIAEKHIEIHNSLLTHNDLPTPTSLDSDVTSSTSAPFSDKLMLRHTILTYQGILTYYGAILSFNYRADVFGSYARLLTEVTQYLEDAFALMIKNKWMEQPPMAADRNALVLKH